MIARIVIVVMLAMSATGCSASLTEDAKINSPLLIGPAPMINSTPMARALACVRRSAKSDFRLGVSEITDGTGVHEGGTTNSKALTQRPDMMMVTALSAAGASLVNRSSVSVTEWELTKAMEKKLGDGRMARMGDEKVAFRPVKAGILLGSTHYVTGAITELNWNIDSGVGEIGGYSVGIGRRTYRISIAFDVAVTNTQTTEIVHARSYAKQVVGVEQNANFFRFFTQSAVFKTAELAALGSPTAAAITQAMELFNANLGEKQNEPVQTALRWVVDLAAYDIVRELSGSGAECDAELPGGAEKKRDVREGEQLITGSLLRAETELNYQQRRPNEIDSPTAIRKSLHDK